MGETTAIHWTNHTWNPWQGCIKVSQGCKNCYMYRDMERYGKDPRDIRRSSDGTFTNPLRWHQPALVFTCSWSDFFIEQADGWRDEAWDIIRRTPHLTYQILTKRPDRIGAHLPWLSEISEASWKNVWLGTSVENNDHIFRVRELVGVSAPVHFLSAEPLLGTLNLRWDLASKDLEWVIVGGESGPGARPMELDWARRIRDDCAEYGVPFFFKQVGGSSKIDGVWGGDLLDGVRYHEFPAVMPAPKQEYHQGELL